MNTDGAETGVPVDGEEDIDCLGNGYAFAFYERDHRRS